MLELSSAGYTLAGKFISNSQEFTQGMLIVDVGLLTAASNACSSVATWTSVPDVSGLLFTALDISIYQKIPFKNHHSHGVSLLSVSQHFFRA